MLPLQSISSGITIHMVAFCSKRHLLTTCELSSTAMDSTVGVIYFSARSSCQIKSIAAFIQKSILNWQQGSKLPRNLEIVSCRPSVRYHNLKSGRREKKAWNGRNIPFGSKCLWASLTMIYDDHKKSMSSKVKKEIRLPFPWTNYYHFSRSKKCPFMLSA